MNLFSAPAPVSWLASIAGGAIGGVVVGLVLAVDGEYLGFLGAMLGAAATIFAGYMALSAVREQIQADDRAKKRDDLAAIEIAEVYVRTVKRACGKLIEMTKPLVEVTGIRSRDEARTIWLRMRSEALSEMDLVQRDDVEAVLRKLPIWIWRPLRRQLAFREDVERFRHIVAKAINEVRGDVETPIPEHEKLASQIRHAHESARELLVELSEAKDLL